VAHQGTARSIHQGIVQRERPDARRQDDIAQLVDRAPTIAESEHHTLGKGIKR
jgi:hypothetical protein